MDGSVLSLSIELCTPYRLRKLGLKDTRQFAQHH